MLFRNAVDFPTQDSWNVPESRFAVYVVRHRDGSLDAFSNICSHMQCPVRWEPPLGQFLCPCHGGLYDMDGLNVGGPPPSPLPQWVHRIVRDPSGRSVLKVQNQFDENI